MIAWLTPVIVKRGMAEYMARNNNFVYPAQQLDATYEVKILIAYFMAQVNIPMTHNQLAEIVTSDDSVNYFLFSEVVSQMLETKMLRVKVIDGVEYYELSPKAMEGANDFKKYVPQKIRERVLSSGLKFFARLKNENDIKVSVSPHGRGYSVNCLCTEGDLVLMNLTVFALDEEQAMLLGERIKQNPAEFYSKVVDYAVDNSDYNPEPEEVSFF